jgi:tRNA threonylcarbamoyladenosine biosynthesis protein TsaB
MTRSFNLMMLMLAVDTSGKDGSIALAECEGEDCSVIEVVPLMGGTFSAQLVPQIAALLKKHGFSKHNIGGFAVASGPGSFTGLRVGLAAIKGLAEVLAKPIAAVSLLEVLAIAAGVPGKVTAVLDAGRGEVYAGTYEVSGKTARRLKENLLSRAEFLNAIPNSNIVTPDPTIAAEARNARARVIETEPVRSDAITPLGWKKIQTGNTILAEELEANYIRRSDAEIFSKPVP